ncbi:MAG TPA: precorrin-6y C5,15-methyltransferase (decarboxylating) subunit CbiE [Methylomusa anaerophila]|uniref:Putative cobalt-precorrin-6Y C(5)-methyltransferase n=1 Tax=Methylomusa anaerophila TaxID=1930071 RepID=A0A348AQE6_9FIRM|nr:precorrin-6y C5,15-methyltransferase (decarboxylating) subunit CbiE [Methylomusa anaerophila]BBB93294.1 putative cobalt-precorrin-6Y C(5)-methyltransferase [Methylomusa anaerophila]HML86875.1 precorrin-6y C5,15-methyltransferase (decarboxylating) subunit CbiE [Methylomusa anaerophila]
MEHDRANHRVIVVGIGPGAPDYVLPVASRIINNAAVLVGSNRALATFAKKNGQETRQIDKDIGGVLSFIAAKLAATDVVVMVSGDPGFYSLLAALKQEFPEPRIQVVPGISSVQLAFARIGELWQDADLISMHGRLPEDEKLSYRQGKKLGILTDQKHNPSYIANVLLTGGWPPASLVWLCAALSYPEEKVLALSLEDTVDISGFDHCVMVVRG